MRSAQHHVIVLLVFLVEDPLGFVQVIVAVAAIIPCIQQVDGYEGRQRSENQVSYLFLFQHFLELKIDKALGVFERTKEYEQYEKIGEHECSEPQRFFKPLLHIVVPHTSFNDQEIGQRYKAHHDRILQCGRHITELFKAIGEIENAIDDPAGFFKSVGAEEDPHELQEDEHKKLVAHVVEPFGQFVELFLTPFFGEKFI